MSGITSNLTYSIKILYKIAMGEKIVKQDSDNNDSQNQTEFVEKMRQQGFGSYDYRNDEMDSDDAYRIGKSLANFYGEGTVVVGRDHRNYSEDLKNGLIDGLSERGNEVEYIGISPTDMVAYRVNTTDAEGGVAVTASHMPSEYRGLKPLNSQGRIFDENELEQVLDGYIQETDRDGNYRTWRTDHLGDAYEDYISGLKHRYNQIFDSDLSDMKIAVDPGNGVGALTLPRLLTDLGVETDNLYVLNNILEPEFTGRGPDPTKSDLNDLKQIVKAQELDLGVALDGDADRAVYVNNRGQEVTGDEALAILSDRYLEDTDLLEASVACSINTSPVVDDLLYRSKENGDLSGNVHYTPVGAVFPAKESLTEKSPVVFGGQPNGHFLDPDFTPYDSGTLFGAVMAGIINEKDVKMSELQEELPSYDIHRGNIEVEDKELAMERLKQNYTGKGNIRTTENAVRVDLGGEDESIDRSSSGVTIIFRPSGNEDVVRWTRVIRDSEKQQELIESYLDQAVSKDS